jgi:hypothetical protein
MAIGVNPTYAQTPPDNRGGLKAHFGYSTVMGAIGATVAPEHKWWILGGCITIGAAKELRDRNKGQPGYQRGLFSRNDMKANALGCLTGVVLTLEF